MRRRLVGIFLLTFGCGGSIHDKPVPAASFATPASSASPRTASDELRHLWPLGDDYDYAAYLQSDGPRGSDSVSRWVPAVLELLKELREKVPPNKRACAAELLGAVRELAIGKKDADQVILVRFDPHEVKYEPLLCLQGIFGGEPTNIAGFTSAYETRRAILAIKYGFFVVVTRTLMPRAFVASRSRPWPDGLDLEREQRLKLKVRLPSENALAEAFIASSPDSLRLEVRARCGSDQAAALLETGAAEARKQVAARMSSRPDDQGAISVLDKLRVVREGPSVTFAIELHEHLVEQGRDIAVVSGLAAYGMQTFLLNAKMAEARQSVLAIAKSEIDAWKRTSPAKRKLVSLPPVPKDVPRGDPYISDAAEWKPWAPLRFSIDGPQYFQYQVVAAPDGKHAEVIARGDLNGDGKLSSLRLELGVEAKDGSLAVSSRLEEKVSEP